MALFDQEAEDYDKWYETRLGAHVDRVETECALHLFQVRPGMRILDVGCGTGNFSLKLAQEGASVTGVDISEKMLAVAYKRALRKKLSIEFKKMDCRNLAFPDDFFDGVLSMATIEFISEPQKMIAEMFRVCKKGGPILVGTINRESEWGQLYQDTEFQKKMPVFKYAHFKSPEDLMQIKEDSYVDIQECLFIPPSIPESAISQKKEEELAGNKRGGFFCILWRKSVPL